MTDGERLAWAAGFFDGEGCILVMGGTQLCMSVTQVDRAPLDRLTEILGGRVHGPRPNRGFRPIFEWKIASSPGVVQALRHLLPFLTCKHAQAVAAIGFPLNQKGQRLSDGVRIQRFVIDAELRLLKKI